MSSDPPFPIAAAWPDPRLRAIQVRGAPNIQPMVERAAEDFMAEAPGRAVAVSAGNSRRGYKGVIDGSCDIGMIATSLTADLARLAHRLRLDLDYTLIGIDGVVPIVHPSNPVADLTLDQLRRIFAGHITTWRAVGGPALPILPLSQPPSLGSYEIFAGRVMADRVFTPRAQVLEGLAVVEKVAVTPGAIGYIASGYLDARVKALRINGIAATAEAFRSGSYPLHRRLTLLMRRHGPPLARAFIAYVADAGKGQRHVAEAGAVAVTSGAGAP
ncbi:phosphate-binding protein PstS 1 precursor [mine drainage metagenome]|uniref:Phosphate-binding protein PstS 1 n=1 Tax=mine drainage metagenome TaxID=410659 RepID=A0A1J5RES3_9ZZZZ